MAELGRARRRADVLIMCGIAGIYNPGGAADEALLRRMTNAMVHRGPDNEGYYLRPPIGLGMRRLSIIDLEGGRQPIGNEDGTLQIVFNGEIYNYRELQVELTAHGHRLATRSDTEVIVHLYEEFGAGCLNRLNGMFAFALWDANREELFLARDRLGVKPLYYWSDGRTLVFASELKALLLHPAVPREFDAQALADYLTFMYIPAPKTPFAGVSKLLPGHYLVANRRGLRLERYWSLADYAAPRNVSLPEAATRVRELLEDSVRLRLRSDVPVGAFLSGGMDSSSVVALAARQMDRPLTTFSVGFTRDGINELPYAKQVAEAYRTIHHEIQATAEDVIRLLPRLIWHMDEPNGDSAMVPTYLVSELAATRVSVILSGLGGDELFAGYPRYQLPLERGGFKRSAYRLLPEFARRGIVLPVAARLTPSLHAKLLAAVATTEERYLASVSIFSPAEKNRLLRKNGWLAPDQVVTYYDAYPGTDPVNRFMFVDAHTYLPDDILALTDRMSMAVSLEARTPFLDYRLVEYCTGLPGSFKLNRSAWKIVLKEAMAGFVPRVVIERDKWGFGAPLSSWLMRRLLPYARSVISRGWLVDSDLVDPAGVDDLLRRFSGAVPEAQQIWTLLVLELWARMYLDGSAATAPPASLDEMVEVRA